MRYSGSEKLEIIKLVEQSNLSACRTLELIGIPRAAFYRWYDLYVTGGPDALEDRKPKAWSRLEPHSRRCKGSDPAAFPG